MELNVARYADASGTVNFTALEQALRECVDQGERSHDETQWQEPQIEYDSWLNRRLAIALRGWGDLVVRRGADPQDLQTLRELESLAEWICQTLKTRSRQLAKINSWCPALDEVGARVLRQGASKLWAPRWRQAVADVALRHRNLTTMSPWDVFPGAGSADLRYADLLPLTRFADSLAFQRDVSITHWNANDFKGFYERVAAIMRCNGGAGLVAMEV